MRSNLTNLVRDARRHDVAHASSARWSAYLGTDGQVDVYHYSTHMLTVEADNEVVPISPGWGSMSDKHGIRKVLNGIPGGGAWMPDEDHGGGLVTPRLVYSYANVYEERPMRLGAPDEQASVVLLSGEVYP